MKKYFTSLAVSLLIPVVAVADITTFDISVDVSNAVPNSYDNPYIDVEAPWGFFNGVTGGAGTSFQSFNAFSGLAADGSQLQLTAELSATWACFDGQHPGEGANQWGVTNSEGEFISMFEFAGIGSGGSMLLDGDENYEFALQNGLGEVFTTDTADNSDGQHHILAQEVTAEGFVDISKADLFDNSSSIDFASIFAAHPDATVYVIYLEDLAGSWPGDFDYNDAVLTLIVEPVPEPATMLLLGLGSGAVILRRRRKEEEGEELGAPLAA